MGCIRVTYGDWSFGPQRIRLSSGSVSGADSANVERQPFWKWPLAIGGTLVGWPLAERLDLLNDLGRVLEQDELLFFYQPLVDLAPGRVKGFEALSRWQRPTRGIVGPGPSSPRPKRSA